MRFSLPIPKTEDDFEHLCCEVLKRHWDRPQLQRCAGMEGAEGVRKASWTLPCRLGLKL